MGEKNTGIIAVYGAGGVGASVIAAHLALTLHQPQTPVTLVDADIQFGVAAFLLGLEPRYSLLDWAHAPDNMDAVQTVLTPHPSGMQVLAAPPHLEDGDQITGSQLHNVLNTLRDAFPLVIVDTGRTLNDVTLAVLEAADVVVTITTPTPAALYHTRRVFDLFRTLPVSPEKVVPVFNQVRTADTPQHLIGLLGRPAAAYFPYQYEHMTALTQAGRPLLTENPPMQEAFDRLATTVVEKLARRQSPAVANGKIDILIVEDEPVTVEGLKKLLAPEHDIQIIGVGRSGREGVDLAFSRRPHVILMDIQLPEIDGIAATEQIMRRLPRTAVIMISLHQDMVYLRRAMMAGARDFLGKPLDRQELVDVIRRQYRRRSAHRSHHRPTLVEGKRTTGSEAVTAVRAPASDLSPVHVQAMIERLSQMSSTPASPQVRRRITPAHAPEVIRVLLAEDEPLLVEMLATYLNRTRDVAVVGQVMDGGREAVEMALQLQPDVVIMDVMMPDQDGITTTEQIKRALPATAIVIHTAVPEIKGKTPALNAGALDYITKPANPQAVYDGVKHVFERNAEIRAAYYKPAANAMRRVRNGQNPPEKLEVDEVVSAYQRTLDRARLLAFGEPYLHLIEKLHQIALSTAHDIRSPLNTVETILTLFTENFNAAEESPYSDLTADTAILNMLDELILQVRTAILNINSFLNISFFENARPHPVNMFEIVEGLAEGLRFIGGAPISIDLNKHMPATASPALLRLALFNILMVATQWSPSAPVEVKMEEQHMIVQVNAALPDGINVLDLTRPGAVSPMDPTGIRLYAADRALRSMDSSLHIGAHFKDKTVFYITPPMEFERTWTREALDRQRRESTALQAHVVGTLERGLSEARAAQVEAMYITIVNNFCRHMLDYLGHLQEALAHLTAEVSTTGVPLAPLTKCARNVQYCELLLRNVLSTVSGVEAQPATVKLRQVIETVTILLEGKAAPAQILFKVEISPPDATLYTDQVLLMQVLMNLARNAIDAIQRDGVIKLIAHQDDEETTIVVSDNGPGISPDAQEQIFALGFSTKPGGYGIGLHSVKSIVERLGGNITLHSTVGKGTAFTITLPPTPA